MNKMQVFWIFLGLKLKEIGRLLAWLSWVVVLIFGFVFLWEYGLTNQARLWVSIVVLTIGWMLAYLYLVLFCGAVIFGTLYLLYTWLSANWEKAQGIVLSSGMDKL
jgi:hypothetical protein